MEKEELEKYYGAYTDCWKILRKFSSPIESEEFWQQLIDESTAVYERNEKMEFVKKMVLLTMDEIDKIYKDGKAVERAKESANEVLLP